MPQDIIVYQYEVCPFCCKLKAFLDYHKVDLQAFYLFLMLALQEQLS